VIGLVIECGCVLWYHNLKSAQSDRLKAARHPITLLYNTALAYCEIELLKLTRYNFQKNFLNRFVSLITVFITFISLSVRLRHYNTVYPRPIPHVRTKRYCSFINYAVQNHQ